MAEPTPRELELAAQNALLTSERDQAFQEIKILRLKLDALAQRLFGKKSEQLNQGQMVLLLQEQTAPGPALGNESGPEEILLPRPNKTARRHKARAPRIPENLLVVEEVIIPEPVKACPEAWRCIGEEVTERLDFKPGHFFKHRIVRRKFVHRSTLDAVPQIAPLTGSLLDRSMVAPGLLAQILVGKFCDHLPLYRQEQIFERRYGVYLPRQTMTRWVLLAADWLKPIYEQIRTGVMGGGYVQIDETVIKYLDPGNGKSKEGRLWVCSQPAGDVTFHWFTNRSAACLDQIVPANFVGTLQCDGYSAYDSFAKSRGPQIDLVGCMAHVRRYFFEAKAQSPRVIAWILRQIQHLYRIEAELRENESGPRLREAVRASQSRPIIVRLHRLFIRLHKSRRYTPENPVAKALQYALGQWESFEIFLNQGRVEIDNNKVENAIRPTAIGRKNWLFFGEEDAGERGAILYTIVESCRRRGIDPYAYLQDVLTRLPSMTNRQIKDYTPEAWAKAQGSSSAALAA